MRYELYPIDTPSFLKLLCVGYAENPTCTYFSGDRKLYIVHYVVSGSGYFNGEKVEAGQGFLITPNIQESYYPSKKQPWAFLWFIFDDVAIEKIFREYNADPKTNIFHFENLEMVKETAKFVMRSTRSKMRSTELLEIYFHIFNAQSKKNQLSVATSSESYFNFSINYIQSNLHSKITVNKLTELLGISQPYLYSIFKERVGLSPKQYIDELRLEKAKRLLRESALPITQIANSVGFSDVLDFSKFFSTKEKISPSNFRKT
jgi:AraC-like DNA-binding protein